MDLREMPCEWQIVWRRKSKKVRASKTKHLERRAPTTKPRIILEVPKKQSVSDSRIEYHVESER